MGFEGTTTKSKPRRTFLGHPLGLLDLFGTELCERFSYYGMRAILVYYIYDTVANGGLAMSESDALVIMSLFGSLVYLSSIVGGWLADRVFGSYRGVLFGGILITAGHIVLGLPLERLGLLVALVLIVLGTGLLKPNVSVMVGQLYEKNDPKRASAFSLFYMAINIGGFASPLIVGGVSAFIGYSIAFIIPAAVMIIALAIYVLLGKTALQGIGRTPLQPFSGGELKRLLSIGTPILILIVLFVAFMFVDGHFSLADVGDYMPIICTIVAAIILFFILRDKSVDKTERSRVFAFMPLFLAGAMFWAIAEQQSSTIALIADTHVNNYVAGFQIPPSWYASVNPLVIIIGSPILAIMWSLLGDKQMSLMVKMAVGLLFAFFGFAVFAVAFWTQGSGLVSPLWILAGLTLMTVGEIFISPTALAATTQLAPRRHMSKMMSLWLISNALGQGVVALTADFFNASAPAGFFFAFAVVALVLGVVLLVAQKPLLKLAQGVR